MNGRPLIWTLLLLVGMVPLQAQTGGRFVYNFLNLNYSSRIMGLGGNLISVHDDCPSLILANPSYISERHHNTLALNYTDYFTHSSAMSAVYSHTFPKAGSFAIGVQALTYGSFNGTDTRKPLGLAEVSITFADCEKELGTDYHEVTVTRRVYRDGPATTP